MNSHHRKIVNLDHAQSGTNGATVSPPSTYTPVPAGAGLRTLLAGRFLPAGVVSVRFVLLSDVWGRPKIRVLIAGAPREKLLPALRAALTRCFIRNMRRAHKNWPAGVTAPHEWEFFVKHAGAIAARLRGSKTARIAHPNLSPRSSPQAAVKTLARQSACAASRVRGARES